MRASLVAAALVLLVAASAHGQGFEGGPEPDHLIPPYRSSPHKVEYLRLIDRFLKPPGRAAAILIYRPSFDPEACLSIWEPRGEDPRFRLAISTTDRNLWYAMTEDRDRSPRRIRRPARGTRFTHVRRFEAPLPPELGRRLLRLWDRMLAESRFPEKRFISGLMDGETWEFRRRQCVGITYTPAETGPYLFTMLGESLLKYGQTGLARRPSALKDVEARCRALEVYLDERKAPGRAKP